MFSGTDGSFDCCTSHLSPLSPSPTPSIPPVFLHVSVVDIDQLKLIMMLVGTPGPELLMKISSESVSVEYHPAQFCHSAPSCLCLCCPGQPTQCIATATSKLHLICPATVCFLNGLILLLGFGCHFFPACAMNCNSVLISSYDRVRGL